jgi:hypothetical protein
MDMEKHNILELIEANARTLFGRHKNYDIVTMQPPPLHSYYIPSHNPVQQNQGPPIPQQAQAFLVAFPLSGEQHDGTVLRSSVSDTPHSVESAIWNLYTLLKEEMVGYPCKFTRRKEKRKGEERC